MGFHLGSELGRIYRGGPYTVPAVINRFTVEDARHGKSIYRGGQKCPSR